MTSDATPGAPGDGIPPDMPGDIPGFGGEGGGIPFGPPPGMPGGGEIPGGGPGFGGGGVPTIPVPGPGAGFGGGAPGGGPGTGTYTLPGIGTVPGPSIDVPLPPFITNPGSLPGDVPVPQGGGSGGGVGPGFGFGDFQFGASMPINNADGTPMLDENGQPIYGHFVFDEEGNLVIGPNGNPIIVRDE